MTFDDWFVKSSIPDSMKHDLFDCWFQALVSRDPEVSELRQQLAELKKQNEELIRTKQKTSLTGEGGASDERALEMRSIGPSA